MHLVAYLLLIVTPCVKKCDLKGRWSKHIGILLTTVIYDTAWGFGLLTDLCASLVYQLAFSILSLLLGLMVFAFFCVLSKKVREAWTPPAKTKIYYVPELHTNTRSTEEFSLHNDVEKGDDDDQVEQCTQF